MSRTHYICFLIEEIAIAAARSGTAAAAIGIEKNKILNAAERGFPLDSDHMYSYVRELIRFSIANRRELRNVRSLFSKIIAAPAAGLINRALAVIVLETKIRK